MRIIRTAALVLFCLSLPILLLTTNVRGAVNEFRLYEYGFQKYGAAERMNLDAGELRRAARELIQYFNSTEEPLSIVAGGRELFNEREVIHLRDVKGLIQLDYLVQKLALAYALAYLGIAWLIQRKGWGRRVAWGAMAGSALTLGLFLIMGLAMALGFEQVFVAFHQVSFSNPFWMLSATDSLILMFPEGFFYDMAMFIALATIVEALLLGGGTFLYLRTSRAKQRKP